jgi:hypothetical protein
MVWGAMMLYRFIPLLGLLVSVSSFGCRLVCSNDDVMLHLMADEITGPFNAVEDSKTLHNNLNCTPLPYTSDNEAERENTRLINICTTPLEADGSQITLRTEMVNTTRAALSAKSTASQISAKEVHWVWLKTKDGKSKEYRRDIFTREDCGSSEEN